MVAYPVQYADAVVVVVIVIYRSKESAGRAACKAALLGRTTTSLSSSSEDVGNYDDVLTIPSSDKNGRTEEGEETLDDVRRGARASVMIEQQLASTSRSLSSFRSGFVSFYADRSLRPDPSRAHSRLVRRPVSTCACMITPFTTDNATSSSSSSRARPF